MKGLNELEALISQASGVALADIYGRSRTAEHVQARHAIWYIAHHYMGHAYTTLGRRYGRDHTTIINGSDRVKNNKEMADSVVAGVQKVNPSLLTISRGHPVENWQFAGETAPNKL